VIKRGLKVVTAAIEVLKEMEQLGTPDYTWVCQPWLQRRFTAVNDDLEKTRGSLKGQIQYLQTAIGVASYAVQLEQLERALDATSSITHGDMKILWRKLIGADKTKTEVSSFCEAFISAVAKQLKDKRGNGFVQEQIGKHGGMQETLMCRYLNRKLNANGDNYITVFELDSALRKMAPNPTALSVDALLKSCMKREQEFQRLIKFQFIVFADAGPDGVLGTADDTLSMAKPGCAVVVRPFHRVMIAAEVPVMDHYHFDHLVMLKYTYSPKSVAGHRDSEGNSLPYKMERIKQSRCYLLPYINQEVVHRKADRLWNSYSSLRSHTGMQGDTQIPIPGFNNGKNFRAFKVDGDTGKVLTKASGEVVSEAEVQNMTKILYMPFLEQPGFYSPRLCLDNYEEESNGYINARNLMKAPKSYLRCQDEVVDASSSGMLQDFSLPPNIGQCVRVLDELEIVWASEIPEAMDVEEEEHVHDGLEHHDFMPLLGDQYPFLPIRRKTFKGMPKKLDVFINTPHYSKKQLQRMDADTVVTHIGLFEWSGVCLSEPFCISEIRCIGDRQHVEIDLDGVDAFEEDQAVTLGFVTPSWRKGSGKPTLMDGAPRVSLRVNEAEADDEDDYNDTDVEDSEEEGDDGEEETKA